MMNGQPIETTAEGETSTFKLVMAAEEFIRWKQRNGLPTVTLSGEVAFKLHDTYGFPLDLTMDICRERGVAVDVASFYAAMERQREQARATSKFKKARHKVGPK